MTKILILTCSLIAFASLANGCSSHETAPEAEFGDAVHNVMNSQIHDYEAAIHPNPNAVEGSDPYRLDAVLNAHREDVGNAEEVQQPISISVGGRQ
jgi:hypothetical protein